MKEAITNKTYRIDSDARQYILVESRVVQNGKAAGTVHESNIGYYGTLESLIKAAKTKMILVHGLDDLQGAMKAFEDLCAQTVKIARNVGGER